MTGKFDLCHVITAKWEGGWSDHAADPGGKTMYGITQATLSAYYGRPASVAEIRGLSKDTAKAIYRSEYWDRVAGDVLPAGVDLCVYDFGVNSGPSRALKSLQAALGVKADGWVGELTMTAIRKADARKLVNTLCERRLAFLRGLPTFGNFGKGWTNRVNDIRARALKMVAGGNPVALPAPAIVPPGSNAKAEPAAVEQKTVSPEQKIGGTAGAVALVLGPVAAFWRDNKDVLADPLFLGVAGTLAVVVVILILRKPKAVEAAP